MFFLPPWHDRKLLECVASGREEGSRTDLYEKIHQVLDRMLIEDGNQFDDVVSKRRIRKGFAQPVEFLDLSFPRERVSETTFVVGLLAIKDFTSLGPDGDAGAEFARISCREDFVRVDLDFAQQRLRVAGPDTRWLELRRSDRLVQKCRSDQIFQIVVRLLFGPGSVLGTEGAATGDVEAGLKDITSDDLYVVCLQAFSASALANGS